MNRFIGACILLVAVAPLRAQDGFRRGDVNGNGGLSIEDAIPMLGAATGASKPLFLDCSGGELLDAADVNDNEHFTIADPLFLLAMLFHGGAAVPEPGVDCGKDPDDDARGFDASDPGYSVRAARLTVTGLEVAVDIEVSAPGAVKAVQLWVRMAPGMTALSFEPHRGVGDVDHALRAEGENALLLLTPKVAAPREVLVSGVGFVPLGTLRFLLPGAGAHAGMDWVPEGKVSGIALRASVLDMDFGDHHPVFVSRVPGTVPTTGFLRGSLDGNAAIEDADLAALDAYLWEGAPLPLGCDGEFAPDAADANDNEYITVADYTKGARRELDYRRRSPVAVRNFRGHGFRSEPADLPLPSGGRAATGPA